MKGGRARVGRGPVEITGHDWKAGVSAIRESDRALAGADRDQARRRWTILAYSQRKAN